MSSGERAEWVYDFNGRGPLTYLQYLQAREFERPIRFAVDEQTRAICVQTEQLETIGIRQVQAIETTSAATNDALYEINSSLYEINRSVRDVSDGVRAVSDGVWAVSDGVRAVEIAVDGVHGAIANMTDVLSRDLREISSALSLGFSELLASQGRINDSIEELIQLTKNPVRTTAYERFELARDNFRRGLFSDALLEIEQAIGGAEGLKTEFRFSTFLGRLRLGDYRNCSADIVNPAAAERAFIDAARYARVDNPEDSARAHILAGRAAFVQGALDRAISHTRAGLELWADQAQGHYQLARLLADTGDTPGAMHHLAEALVLDPDLCVSAIALGDIADRSLVNRAAKKAAACLKDRFQVAAAAVDAVLTTLKAIAVPRDLGISVDELVERKTLAVHELRRRTQNQADSGVLQDIHLAICTLRANEQRITRTWSDVTEALAAAAETLAVAQQKDLARLRSQVERDAERLKSDLKADLEQLTTAQHALLDRASSLLKQQRNTEKEIEAAHHGNINGLGCLLTLIALIFASFVAFHLVPRFVYPEAKSGEDGKVLAQWLVFFLSTGGTIVVTRTVIAVSSGLIRDRRLEDIGSRTRAGVDSLNAEVDSIAREMTKIQDTGDRELAALQRAFEHDVAKAQRIHYRLVEFSGEIRLRIPPDEIGLLPRAMATGRANSFVLTIQLAGERRINVIKVLRTACPSLDHENAKAIIERLPRTLSIVATDSEVAALRVQFAEAGAKVSIAPL